MAQNNVLYFLAKRETYRYGKINALSAQSSILKSRESIKRLLSLKEQEKSLRLKMLRDVAKLRKSLQAFEKLLPHRRRREAPKKLEHPESLSSEELRRAKRTVYRDPIHQELSNIEEKLRALGASTS